MNGSKQLCGRQFRISQWVRRTALALFAGITVVGFANSARAEEPVERFLDALKESGFYDVAYEYLNTAEKSDRIPVQMRKRIAFEKASVLIDGIDQVRDSKKRDTNLDLSQSLLNNFVKEETG